MNSLEHRPAHGEYLLTTNRGFFRIDPEDDSVKRVRGHGRGRRQALDDRHVPRAQRRRAGAAGRLGHPDQRTLPQYLGFLRSDDGGRTWRVVSRLGDADLHKIVFKHDRLYALDAVLSAIVISEDGGRTFTERFTPRGLIVDFDVDPANPRPDPRRDRRRAVPLGGRRRDAGGRCCSRRARGWPGPRPTGCTWPRRTAR